MLNRRVLIAFGVVALTSNLAMAHRTSMLSLGNNALAMHASSIVFLRSYWWHDELIELMCLRIFIGLL